MLVDDNYDDYEYEFDCDDNDYDLVSGLVWKLLGTKMKGRKKKKEKTSSSNEVHGRFSEVVSDSLKRGFTKGRKGEKGGEGHTLV